MKYFRSVFGALTSGQGGGVRDNTHYSAVNTQEPLGFQDSVYAPTTVPERSLNPAIAVFDRFLQGRLHQKKQRSKWVFLTMVLGLFALTFGSLLIVIDPYSIIFTMKTRFSEGTDTFEMWRKPPIKLVLKVYLFNVTNKEEYMSGKDSKLKFQQVGPYAYREDMSHSNVTFNSNGTMTSIPLHPLTWLPELSNGTEEDLLYLPNIALLSIANVMNDATFFTRVGLNLVIKKTSSEPLVKMTAKEFMFGYKSTLLSLGNTFMPSWIYFDKLGLIDRMYDFDGDTSTIYTGETDLRLSGLFENYNRRPYLPQWDGAPCNAVSRASDGTKFPSLIKPNDTLLFFRKSLCRSMPLVRVGEDWVSGMNGYRYHFRKGALDNGHNETANKCFCRKGNCLPAGLIDVTDCYYGFPIALSYPHFMEADETLIDSVEGIRPNPDIHSTHFIVNPESGLPLQLSVKMQINMALGDLNNIANCKLFSHTVLPMLWTDIYFDELPTSMATRFYIYLRVGPIAQTIFTYLFLIGGMSFILLSLASAFCIPKDIKLKEATVWKEEAFRHQVVEKEMNKQRLKETTNNTKEMEVYYCSLLRTNEDTEEDSVLQRTLDSFEEVEV
ncbi:scavenger receptor class B member 1-like isoform X1 [Homalodisca vitripennis]|uniref:scavenger receptor class B member 1-like isoform X1 n=1 Tax=Homalodisca vitripennis TaxID=197043 RepID=UPI001EECA8FE|nr:scavenger receptor class B member 1-like isoform X1 [Homalodisca vitripennis]